MLTLGWKILISSSKKPIAIVLIIAIVISLTLFVLGIISQFWFWIVVIVTAFLAYKVIPKLEKV